MVDNVICKPNMGGGLKGRGIAPLHRVCTGCGQSFCSYISTGEFTEVVVNTEGTEDTEILSNV